MGSDSTLVFYGLRFETTDTESGPLSDQSDPRIVLASQHDLAHWWGSFSIWLIAKVLHQHRFESSGKQGFLAFGCVAALFGRAIDHINEQEYLFIGSLVGHIGNEGV